MIHFPFVLIMCNQSLKNRGIRWRFKCDWMPVNHKMFMLPLLDVTTRFWFPNHETIACVTQFISPSNYFCHKLGWMRCDEGEYPAVEDFILWKVGVRSCTFPPLSKPVNNSLPTSVWLSVTQPLLPHPKHHPSSCLIPDC